MLSHENIIVRSLQSPDFNALLNYLHNLSAETKSRFGPHAFDAASVIQFYNSNDNTGFIATEPDSHSIIAYSIIKEGILFHDKNRLNGYQYPEIEKDACTYAPSVADYWQGKGIGRLMFQQIMIDCRKKKFKRMILWGGVQCSNEKARQFYQKLGFITLGQFEYNGLNQDMLLEL